ncbi:hypothetical protein BX666DRAFT_1906529 [Dichotomocladium elegans]|nr:hypothetical protein BX666DRAFT_1906529 [Dichotomocladium elegans]
MYSPTYHSFRIKDDNAHQHSFPLTPGTSTSSPHPTLGASSVRRGSRLFSPQTVPSLFHPPYHNNNNNNDNNNNLRQHQRQGSLGSMGNAIAMSPRARPIPFGDPAITPNWFGTSLDSAGSSYRQSPAVHDLVISPSTSANKMDGCDSEFTEDNEEAQQRNLQEIFDKRRRRRESHNAVERRRRDNINERIQDLCHLLPEHMLDNAPSAINTSSVPFHYLGGGSNSSNSSSTQRTVNKGTILKLSVDHIRELQSEVSRYQIRVRELEQVIEELRYRNETKISPNGERPPQDHQHPLPQSSQLQSLTASSTFGDLHVSPD